MSCNQTGKNHASPASLAATRAPKVRIRAKVGSTSRCGNSTIKYHRKNTIHPSSTHPITPAIQRLGLMETGHLPGHPDIVLKAKMDTGAVLSSIDAHNLQPFLQHGNPWVRFQLPLAGEQLTLTYPVKECIRIKRPGEGAMERLVIDMAIRIGHITRHVGVTLNNRRGFSCPLLIGRNFLEHRAIVDVQQQGLAERKYPNQEQHLPVIGAIEPLYLSDIHARFAARIDTGAQTSSLDARNLALFERHGQHWVRFNLPDYQNPCEYPVVRFVRIKRHGLTAERRPVIRLQARIGSIHIATEFTLRNRSGYDYPALIGARFLSGQALVDVAKKHLTD